VRPDPFPLGAPTRPRTLEDALGEIRFLWEAIADLRRREEKQAVLVRALVALLSEKQGLTEAELLDRFRQVEVEKAGIPPRKCAQCGRSVNQRTHRCLYCDEACPVESAFELLDLGPWPDLPPQAAEPAGRPALEHAITTRDAITTRPAG
jgi:hypothetical protein